MKVHTFCRSTCNSVYVIKDKNAIKTRNDQAYHKTYISTAEISEHIINTSNTQYLVRNSVIQARTQVARGGWWEEGRGAARGACSQRPR